MPATKLPEALDILRLRGWTQLHRENPVTGKVCLVGALCLAHFGNPNTIRYRDNNHLNTAYEADTIALRCVLSEQYPMGDAVSSIQRYNDVALTTQAEAEAMLEKAALRVAEEI